MKWLLLLAAAAPAFAQCNYNVTPASFSVPAGGLASGQITVSGGASGCSYSFATDSPSWITFPGAATDSKGNYVPQSGPTLTFAAAASTLPVPRQAIIQVAGVNVTISQAAANCTMTLNPATATIGVAAGSGSFQVQTSCTWAAQSESGFLSISPSNTAFAGNGPVSYSVTANLCVAPRIGYVAVTAQPTQIFTLTQSGADSNLTASPASLNPPVAGVAGAISVLTGSGCSWSAYSDVNFVHFTSPTSGSGVGSLGYSIDANTGVARTGNIHIGNLLIPVSQPAAAGATPTITAIRNGASFATGTAAPGEIVSLFGTAMGPATGLGLQVSNGSVGTNLGGAQVFFDGVPAPLIYASATQINTVVPYRIAGNASTAVTVQYGGVTSAPTTLTLASVAPAIFTQDGSGSGSGAILNQDYSVNNRLNAAARGSVVAIYLTGAGVTTPASADGSVIASAPPFPALAQTATVTIGGVTVPAAQVVYSGAAPGAIAGLTQIDAIIPQSVTPGPSVSLTVTIAGVSTQAGITLAVQ